MHKLYCKIWRIDFLTKLFFCSSTDATALSFAFFGQGTGPILLDDVHCNGTEDRLVDCPYDPSTLDCVHSEDASVRCQITREYDPYAIIVNGRNHCHIP